MSIMSGKTIFFVCLSFMVKQGSFQETPGLKTLAPTKCDLSNNPLDSLTTIAGLPIQELNVSNCQLDYIEDYALQNLKDLVVLDLSRNMISTGMLSRRTFETTPSSGQQRPSIFTKMRALNLSFNDIYSLPQDIFSSMTELTSLDLSGNPLAYIDQLTMAAITDLTKLKELKLSSCELDSLPEGLFRRTRRLETLDLSDNRFTTPPAVLAEATSLVALSFNKNPVVSLSEETSISSLKNLKQLSLCRLSKLQSISAGALGGLASLTSLKICHNPRLTILDPAALMWIDDHDVERYPVLETLHVTSNNLTFIDSHLLDRWDQLTDIQLSGNPYQCDCGAQWMLTVLVPLVADHARDMHCSKPAELRGLSFAKLQELSITLKCPKTISAGIPAPDAAILLGIMIGIFTTFPIVLVVVLLWRKGFFKKCRRHVNNEKHYYDEDDAL